MRGFFAFNCLSEHPNTWTAIRDTEAVSKAVADGLKKVQIMIQNTPMPMTISYEEAGDRNDGPAGKATGGFLHDGKHKRKVRRMYGSPERLREANSAAAHLRKLLLATMEEDAAPVAKQQKTS